MDGENDGVRLPYQKELAEAVSELKRLNDNIEAIRETAKKIPPGAIQKTLGAVMKFLGIH